MLTNTNIDIFIIIFVAIFAIVGYFRGFILRVYDLMVTVLTIAIAYYLSGPISLMFTSPTVGTFEFTSILLNRVIAFVVLLAIVRIILGIISVMIRPILKKVSELPLVNGVNRFLGVVISLVESLVIVYVLLVAFAIASNDVQIEETVVANTVMSLAPDYANEVTSYIDSLNLLDNLENYTSDGIDNNSIYYTALALNTALDHDFITAELFEDKATSYLSQVAKIDGTIEMEASQYREVEKLLDRLVDFDGSSIVNKIEVING